MTRTIVQRLARAATLALVLGHYLWTISSSGRPLDFRAASTEYYNRLTDALLEGRLRLLPDPDPALLALPNPYGAANQPYRVANVTQDLSLFDGRYYLYFGIAPALTVFLPFRVLSGGLSLPQGLAAAVLLFGAVAWSAAAFVVLQRRLDPEASLLVRTLSLVVLGLGNFGPFILRRAVVYEVAATAAAFFQSAALFWLVKAALATRPRPALLAAAGTCVVLAVGSRPTQAPLLALLAVAAVWLRLHRPENRRALVALVAPAVLGVIGLAAYNQARFGSPWEFGLRYELSDWDIRNMRLFSLSYLPFNLAGNLLAPARLDPEFPFFHVMPALPIAAPPGYMMVETRVGLFRCMPLAALALAWPFLLRGARDEKRRATLLGCALAATGLLLALEVGTFAASSIRFSLDFSMPILVSAALAWVGLEDAWRERRTARLALRAACVAAVAYGTAVNLALGLTGLYDWLRRGEPATYARLEAWAAPLQRLGLALHRRAYGDVRMTFRLAPAPPGQTEVVMATGALYRHDVLCIRYLSGDRVAFKFDHRGFEPLRSAPRPAAPGETHTLEVAMGSLYPINRQALARSYPALAARGVDRQLGVRFDGEEVLAGDFDFVPSAPEAVRFGKDDWGNGSCRDPLSGEILRIERGFPP